MISSDRHSSLPISVVIPTYEREEVLITTLEQILSQVPAAGEVLVVDQTRDHDASTMDLLTKWHDGGIIRWIRLESPSQPAALNSALLQATQPIVLFLDDDIKVGSGFVAAHALAFEDPSIWAVVGQILQPGETPLTDFVHVPAGGVLADLLFPFRSARPAWIQNGMSGNMSVRRGHAIEIGGFDENYAPPVSYRFDSDFCKRVVRAGGRIRFVPDASIHHLRASRGGTRSVGSHLTSASPVHGVGDYYFALRLGISSETMRYILTRPWREVRTRFHLRHPWWIPVKLIGEVRALVLALSLWRRGPRFLAAVSHRDDDGS